MNYFELWIGRYKAATSDLTLEQHGAYFLLMQHYYATEKPLPRDYVELYIICAAITSKRREAVRSVADRFFPINERGERSNANCDEIIRKYQNKSVAGSINGKLGGRPPKPKPKAKSKANEKLNDKVDKSTTIHNPQSTTHKGKEEREARPPNLESVLALFQERGYPEAEAPKFWHYYEANGWRVGKNPMRDWKAAAAGWISRSKEFQPIKTYSNGKQQPTGADLIASAAKHRANFEAVDEKFK